MKKESAMAFALIMLLGSGVASANTCDLPNAPSVPQILADQAQAQSLRNAVFAYLDAGEAYMKCLEAERASYGETITPEISQDIDDKLAIIVAAQKASALAWNLSYGDFLSANQ